MKFDVRSSRKRDPEKSSVDQRIPVIDLFAGPGGLSEGFSAFSKKGRRAFATQLSIEKEIHAHCTLELRAFFRQFRKSNVPDDYYRYVKGIISREELFDRYPKQALAARSEAWLAELGDESTSDNCVDARIRQALGTARDWVLIGGPPCQAYSLVGRSRIKGNNARKYNRDPRHFLYREYLRILAEHAPPVFVMENVKGILSATVRKERIFERIMSDLAFPRGALPGHTSRRSLEYRLVSITRPKAGRSHFEPEEYVVKAEDYGIPQARHRVIILGIRSDITAEQGTLTHSRRLNIEDVISDLPALRSGLSKEQDSADAWGAAVRRIVDGKWFSKGCIDGAMRDAVLAAARKVEASFGRGDEFLICGSKPVGHGAWFHDKKLGGALNHVTRGHIAEDLHRYLFASVFARTKGRTPLLQDFPEPLLPKHKNVRTALKKTKFNDRFRVQIMGRPSTTVVSHIAKDGHYFIHFDPLQCRSLTVREAARLQTFPDNYFFEGPRTEQYRQVGNAVPPLLARQIAEIVSDLFSRG